MGWAGAAPDLMGLLGPACDAVRHSGERHRLIEEILILNSRQKNSDQIFRKPTTSE